MLYCPCGSQENFRQCCGPYLDGSQTPPTAESLMRSRYTAFSRGATAYLMDTVHPEKRHEHKTDEIGRWARDSDWRSLEILASNAGGIDDEEGEVEFIATYHNGAGPQRHHELAQFRKQEGKWFFYDGERPRQKPVVRTTPKVGRNDPCPCGSGKKFKKCCAR